MNYLRAGIRIPVELPVHVRWKNRAGSFRRVQGKTGNISANGLFMTVPIRLRCETLITFTVILPAEVTKVPVEILCQGRVVRRNRPGELPGVGAIIDDYQLRPAHLQV